MVPHWSNPAESTDGLRTLPLLGFGVALTVEGGHNELPSEVLLECIGKFWLTCLFVVDDSPYPDVGQFSTKNGNQPH